MLLVRHNRLLPPFDDYGALSVAQLDRLAAGDISPPIAALPSPLPWTSMLMDKMRSAEKIVSSPSLRARQTAEGVMAALGIDKKVETDDRLREIYFVPSLLMKSVDENPLQAVRMRLYDAIAQNRVGVEPFEELELRLAQIHKNYAAQNCVLFTHGFLIRLYINYKTCGLNIKKACAEISSVPSFDYLQAVDI